METSSRKLLSASALAALTLLLLPAWGNAQAQRREGAEPVLSLHADWSTQDREFTSDDTLHMWLPSPAGKTDLGGPEGSAPTGTWSLASASQSFAGELVARGGGLSAAFPLAAVETTDSAWSWSASVLWNGVTVATTNLELTLTLLAPRARLGAATLEGEAPLLVRFEDQSLGFVTSRTFDFGDGASASEPTPEHLYRTPGDYEVSLRAANPAGSSELAHAVIHVREQDLALHYGMNASENVWWQRGIAFADALARAGEFFRVVNGTINRVPAPLIPHESGQLGAGWPDLSGLAAGEKAGTRLFGSMGGSMPDGRELPYVLTWEGAGSCQLSGQAVLSEANRTPNRVEVFVDPTAGDGDSLLIWLVEESDSTDPVRNAHVWLPGMEATQPILWPPFVERLQAMNGGRGPVAWRAMDWNEVNQYGRTDGSAPFVFDLAGRITPASPSQGTKRGVCAEFQVALCNAVGADLHFNVPHAANGISDADYEAFLRDVFVRIRDGAPAVPGVNGGQPFAPLAPNLRLVLEYSNEIWNPSFPVNPWLKTHAQAAGRSLPQQAAYEIARVFALARELFAGADAPRLQTFVGGWLGDPSFLLEVLAWLGPSVQIDSAGPACYFGPRKPDIEDWMSGAVPGNCPNCPTPEAVVESARMRIGELDLKLLESQLVVAAHTNPDGSTPRLVLYEGGASFNAGFQPWGPAACQAQRLPAMYDAYLLDFVPALVTRGVDEVLWYSFMTDGNSQGSAGPFGHWERMDQTLTLPVPDVYLDEGVPKAAAIYKLPPRR